MIETRHMNVKKLETFIIQVLQKNNVSERDAQIVSEVLLASDKRGIASHGVARLKRYIDHIQEGVIIPDATLKIIHETPVSLVVDGQGGLGQPIAFDIMNKCIDKASESGMCFASIRNSNHYGIAGFYTQLALKKEFIGISATNSAPLVVPTFSKDAIIGTNPWSIGFPGTKNHFLLDMATSTVPRGKLEVYARENNEIPLVWATDETGAPTGDPKKVLDNLKQRLGGGLLPLGGGSEETGGHKGYGLSVMVDLLSSGLSQGAMGVTVYEKPKKPSGVCHFLGAIDPDIFCGKENLKQQVDEYIRMLKNARKAKGKETIFVAGEKESLLEKEQKDIVLIQESVFQTLQQIGKKSGVQLDLVY